VLFSNGKEEIIGEEEADSGRTNGPDNVENYFDISSQYGKQDNNRIEQGS